VFTIVFFAAFHEFVKMAKERYRESRQHSDSTDGEMPLIDMHAQGTYTCTFYIYIVD